MARRLLRGARILEGPASGFDRVGDLLIEDGKIAAIAPRIPLDDADVEVEVVDGCLVTPAFIDAHCHLREPGREDKETIASGGAAAARGGFAAVTAMANTNPVNDNAAVTQFILEQAAKTSPVLVLPVGAVTRGLQGAELADFGELKEAGVVALSDDGRPIMNAALMRRALEYAGRFALPIITHNEDETLAAGGSMNEGAVSFALGLGGIPAAAESVQIARDLELMRLTRGRVHAAHVSTAGSVALIRRGKEEGLAITAEVTPHHLLLTDAAVRSYDTRTKMNPPLRSEADREAVVRGLAEGTLDIVATDHAPHTAAEKELEYDAAPSGVIGLETAFPLCYTYLVEKGLLSLQRLVAALTAGPAQVLALADLGCLRVGGPATLAIIRIGVQERITSADFASKSRNTPFESWAVGCRIEATYRDGKEVYRHRAEGGSRSPMPYD
ncbi:MAG: dihydroorotase [Candidatus Schekmanbacteria bacterium]|nr:dihydroorotase [Candidatus Schekmanbacteria bacterium]